MDQGSNIIFLCGLDASQHVYFAVSGLILCFFICGEAGTWTVLQTILASWLTMNLGCALRIRGTAAVAVAVGTMWLLIRTHLDTPASPVLAVLMVLTLRLVGTAVDLYDWPREGGLAYAPSPLELLGYCLFAGGLHIGPGPYYPLQHYSSFVARPLMPPGGLRAAAARLATGLAMMGLATALFGLVPAATLSDPTFLHQSLWYKFAVVWIVSKLDFMLFMSNWVINEATLMTAGISWDGHSWDGLSNVQVNNFETATSLDGCYRAYHNTRGRWMSRYILARLQPHLPEDVVSIIASILLAIWLGFQPGFFLCFAFEHVAVKADNFLRWAMADSTSPITLLAGYLMRTSALHYAQMTFIVTDWAGAMRLYQTLYFLPHWIALGIWVAGAAWQVTRTKTKQD